MQVQTHVTKSITAVQTLPALVCMSSRLGAHFACCQRAQHQNCRGKHHKQSHRRPSKSHISRSFVKGTGLDRATKQPIWCCAHTKFSTVQSGVASSDSPPWLFLCPACQQNWQWRRMASCPGHCICQAPKTQAACWCPQPSGHTAVMAQAGSGPESVSQQTLVNDAAQPCSRNI